MKKDKPLGVATSADSLMGMWVRGEWLAIKERDDEKYLEDMEEVK